MSGPPAIVFDEGNGDATLFGVESLSVSRGNARILAAAAAGDDGMFSALDESERAQVQALRAQLAGAPGVSPYSTRKPVVTQLNISNTVGCNMACSYCYKDFPENKPRENSARAMTLEVAKQSVDALVAQAQGEPRLSLVFLGGEPLLQPELLKQAVAYGRERAQTIDAELDAVVYTNGLKLDRDTVEWANDENVSLIISIDGPSSLHDRHRVTVAGEPTSSQVLQATELIMRHSTHPMRRVRCVMSEPGALVALHQYLYDLGFNDIWVQAVYDAGGMASRGDDAEHRALLDWYRALLLAGVIIRVNPVDRFLEGLLGRRSALSSWYPCGAGLFLLGVDPGGRLSPCHHFLEESDYSLGHVAQGIPDADARKGISKSVELREPCQSCWARHLCGGECYHRALTVDGRYDGTIEPVCDERRALIRDTLTLFADVMARRPTALEHLAANRLSLPAPNPRAFHAVDLAAYGVKPRRRGLRIVT